MKKLVLLACLSLPACAAIISLGDQPTERDDANDGGPDALQTNPDGDIDGGFDGSIFDGSGGIVDETFGVGGQVIIAGSHVNAIGLDPSNRELVWVGQRDPSAPTMGRYQRFDADGHPLTPVIDLALSTKMADNGTSVSERALAVYVRSDGTFWLGMSHEYRSVDAGTSLGGYASYRRMDPAGGIAEESQPVQFGAPSEVVEIVEGHGEVSSIAHGSPDRFFGRGAFYSMTGTAKGIVYSDNTSIVVAAETNPADPRLVVLEALLYNLTPNNPPFGTDHTATIVMGTTISNVDIAVAPQNQFLVVGQDGTMLRTVRINESGKVTSAISGLAPRAASPALQKLVARGSAHVAVGCAGIPPNTAPWLRGITVGSDGGTDDPSFYDAGELVLEGLPQSCIKDAIVDASNRILLLITTTGGNDRIIRLK